MNEITLSPMMLNDNTNREEKIDRIANDIEFIEKNLTIAGEVLLAISHENKLMDIIEYGNNNDTAGMDIVLINLLNWVLDNREVFENFITMFETD